jgi:hypothetical protein
MSIVVTYAPPRNVYAATFSGTVTVPDSVTRLYAWVQGAGGAGRQFYDPFTALDWDSGGGGGGFSYFETAILEVEWGTSITLTVGSPVDGANGEASSLTGTLGGTAFVVTANGGTRAAAGGAGGTASGGTLDISGGFGEAANPGDGAPGAAGLPGGDGQEGGEPGGGGGLGVTLADAGYIVLLWG